jgi:PPOX class probable F420-dependent enzyme
MAKMTRTEREAFLAEVRVGVLSIAEEGRGPLTVPIWYGYEPGGELWIWTDTSSRKYALLQAAGRASLCVQQEAPPYRYVSVEGPVTAIRAARAEDIRQLALRYLAENEAEQFLAQLAEGVATETDCIIHIRPERWLSLA